jgi:hypothetical protein
VEGRSFKSKSVTISSPQTKRGTKITREKKIAGKGNLRGRKKRETEKKRETIAVSKICICNFCSGLIYRIKSSQKP